MNPIWIFGFFMIVPAALLTFFAAVPAHDFLPMSRRRQSFPPPSALTVATNATTSWMSRLLTGRESAIGEWMSSASIRMRPVDFTLIAFAGGLVGAVIGTFMGGVLTGIVGFAAVLILVFLVVQVRISKRRKKIGKQMIETLSTLSGALRSGQSMNQALAMVAEECDAPTSEEFARVINEVRIGYDLTAALNSMASRTGSEDLTWVVRAIAINREVGGSLADIMDGVAETIQGRVEMRSEIDALAGEGKMSAYILVGMPFFIAGIISFTAPGYLTPLFTTTLGWLLTGAAAVMLTIGSLWMKSSIKVKF